MSTLAEIERAADRLSPAEQEKLLRHISMRLRGRQGAPSAISRRLWMDRLERFRAQIRTGSQVSGSEEILEALREERL